MTQKHVWDKLEIYDMSTFIINVVYIVDEQDLCPWPLHIEALEQDLWLALRQFW